MLYWYTIIESCPVFIVLNYYPIDSIFYSNTWIRLPENSIWPIKYTNTILSSQQKSKFNIPDQLRSIFLFSSVSIINIFSPFSFIGLPVGHMNQVFVLFCTPIRTVFWGGTWLWIKLLGQWRKMVSIVFSFYWCPYVRQNSYAYVPIMALVP